MAAQFTATKRPFERRDFRWMKRAISSLPVPDSPVIMMLASDGATCSARRITWPMTGSRNRMVLASAVTASSTAAISSASGGSGMYSLAPALMARTAADESDWMPQAMTGTVMRSAISASTSALTSKVTSIITRSTPAPPRSTSMPASMVPACMTRAPRSMAMRLAAPTCPSNVPMIRSCMGL